MPEYLDATWVSWVKNLPKVELTASIVAVAESGVVDLLEQHTVRVIDEKGNPTWISVVLWADIIFWDDK